MQTKIFPTVRLQSNSAFTCDLSQCKRAVGLATYLINEQNTAALADVGVRQHGFCELNEVVGGS